MDWGLFNISVHIFVIKLVPSAIHVYVLCPSICISCTSAHWSGVSQTHLPVHSQPEGKDLSRQQGSRQQALLLVQQANIVVNNMCSFVIKLAFVSGAINVLCDHFSCRLSTQDKIVALALLFLLIRSSCCFMPWPQSVALCCDSCMSPTSFRLILQMIDAGTSWVFLVPPPPPSHPFSLLQN